MREFLIPLFNWNHHPRHHHLYHCHHDFNHENTIHVFFLQAGREELLLEMYSNMMDSMKAFWTHTLELLPIIQILPNTTRRLQSRLKLSRAQWHFFRLPSFRLIPFVSDSIPHMIWSDARICWKLNLVSILIFLKESIPHVIKYELRFDRLEEAVSRLEYSLLSSLPSLSLSSPSSSSQYFYLQCVGLVWDFPVLPRQERRSWENDPRGLCQVCCQSRWGEFIAPKALENSDW